MELLSQNKDKRSKLIFYFFFVVLLVFVFRLYYLQVVKVAYFKKVSEKNCIRPVSLVSPRGLISDRNGRVLVSDFPSYTLLVMPGEVENLEKTFNELRAQGVKFEWDKIIDGSRGSRVAFFKAEEFNGVYIELVQKH